MAKLELDFGPGSGFDEALEKLRLYCHRGPLFEGTVSLEELIAIRDKVRNEPSAKYCVVDVGPNDRTIQVQVSVDPGKAVEFWSDVSLIKTLNEPKHLFITDWQNKELGRGPLFEGKVKLKTLRAIEQAWEEGEYSVIIEVIEGDPEKDLEVAVRGAVDPKNANEFWRKVQLFEVLSYDPNEDE